MTLGKGARGRARTAPSDKTAMVGVQVEGSAGAQRPRPVQGAQGWTGELEVGELGKGARTGGQPRTAGPGPAPPVQTGAGREAAGRGRGADLVQGADAVGVGGVEHGAGGRRGGGVGLGAGVGVGRAQHQAGLVQVAARAGRQELGGALEAHGADAPLPRARLGARPRPPLPQLLPPPLAGRRRRRPRARPVLARHRVARPLRERASERPASAAAAAAARPGAAGNCRWPRAARRRRCRPRPARDVTTPARGSLGNAVQGSQRTAGERWEVESLARGGC